MLLPGNKTFDITVPCTSDFLEPQNKAVILSSRLNPNNLQIKKMIPNIVKNSKTIQAPKNRMFPKLKPVNICRANDSQNDV